MRLLPTRRLVADAILAADVHAGGADMTPLLRSGTKVTPDYAQRLIGAGINAVWVEDIASAGIRATPLISDSERSQATKGVREAMVSLRDGSQGAQISERQLACLQQVTVRLAEQLRDASEAGIALADLSSADNYAYRHAVNTTALGLLIGEHLIRRHGYLDWERKRQYRNLDTRLLKLGLGLLLHDVGMLSVPDAIIHKQGPLTREEMAIMREHPAVGAKMFSSWTVSPLVQAVIRRHHERWDGGGYPYGLAGEDIHQLGRVAAVVDVYCAMTSNRPHAPARPPEVAWQTIIDGADSAFDPLVVEVFRSHVPPYPVGTEVLLNTGARALVASVSSDGGLERPAVRTIETVNGQDSPGSEIDLHTSPDVSIMRSVPVAQDAEPAAVEAPFAPAAPALLAA